MLQIKSAMGSSAAARSATYVVFMVIFVSAIVIASVNVLVSIALRTWIGRHGGHDHSNASDL